MSDICVGEHFIAAAVVGDTAIIAIKGFAVSEGIVIIESYMIVSKINPRIAMEKAINLFYARFRKT